MTLVVASVCCDFLQYPIPTACTCTCSLSLCVALPLSPRASLLPLPTRHRHNASPADTKQGSLVFSPGLCLRWCVPIVLPPTLAGPQDQSVMEAEEESPQYVAAPSTNDSGGAAGEPKRTSSRNWGQHWQDLDRDYFRPVSAADIENLRTQVWWLDGGCWMSTRKCACIVCGMGPDRLPPPPTHSSKAWNK